MEIIRYTEAGAKEKIADFLQRDELDPEVEESVWNILQKVRLFGDKAVSEYTQSLDDVLIPPGKSKVETAEFLAAVEQVHPTFRRAFEEARKNIRSYYQMQQRKPCKRSEKKSGLSLQMVITPIETVGIYIPGGTAPLVSTVLMTVVPAQLAGVSRIVICTPPNVSAKIHPYILAACHLLGVQDVFKVGGAQAIAGMAYGTQSIPRVDKIYGPGNIYVTAAKAMVFGQVGVDLIAGPSEIAILADSSADPQHLAADMISQAEHDSLSKSVLITDSEKILQETKRHMYEQLHGLPRREIVEESLRDYCLMVLVPDMKQGVEIANELAPEHLQIVTRNPRRLLSGVRNAGTVLLGPYSPAVVGDFVAGPSHVLPTNRSARAFSGICLDDFLKKTNVIEFSQQGLARSLDTIREFSRIEGLEGHFRSAQIRLLDKKVQHAKKSR